MTEPVLYRKEKRRFWDDDLGEYQGWCVLACEDAPLWERIVGAVQDVSTNQDFVCKLVEKLNSGRVSLYHLGDIIEDDLP